MRTISTLFTLFLAGFALAQTPILVKDIIPGGFSGISTTSNAAVIGNTLFFTGYTTMEGDELWKTDGTADGTVLVKDIKPGDGGSFQKFHTVFKDQLYLVAETPDLGSELWHTDDIEGAVLAAGDACLGSCSGAFYGSSERLFAEHEGNLYFKIHSAAWGSEIWTTDGSSSGATLFVDIKPGSGSSYPYAFTVFNEKLYFVADSANVGSELWVSDWTPSGTHLLKDVNPNPFQGSDIAPPVVGTDAFYFWAKNNSSAGAELWKSDGTAQGTIQLKEIGPGNASGQPPSVPLSNSVWLGNQLLFTANDGTTGAELWITDGTESGTQLLLDINAGAAGSNLSFLTAWNGKAYFIATTVGNGREIWVSDGTVAGTQILKDINPGSGDGVFPFGAVDFIIHGDKLYFTANDGTTGYEIWVTDGTSAGTQLVYDLNPGSTGSTPKTYRIMGNYIYFFATTQATGTELWKFPLPTSSTSDLENHLDIKIYPTLSTDGVFHLQHGDESATVLDVQVFNAVGNLVHRSEHSASQSLHLSTLPSGSYFIRVTTTDGRFSTQKVVIGR
jgi:ELWxxDGT repeat protein